jgi:hypothetical protein
LLLYMPIFYWKFMLLFLCLQTNKQLSITNENGKNYFCCGQWWSSWVDRRVHFIQSLSSFRGKTVGICEGCRWTSIAF